MNLSNTSAATEGVLWGCYGMGCDVMECYEVLGGVMGWDVMGWDGMLWGVMGCYVSPDPLAQILTGKTQPKSHLFSKVDNVNVDLLLLQTLCQLHQLQQGNGAALVPHCPHLSSQPNPPIGNLGTALKILTKQSPKSAPQLQLQPTLPCWGTAFHSEQSKEQATHLV